MTEENEKNALPITETEESMPERKIAEYDPEKPMIALTFDDGPNLTATPRVLDKLEEYGITATFFLIGSNINDETAEVSKRAYYMGCDIENHSFTHPMMNEMTEDEIREEYSKTAELVKGITGEYPKFFRPPYIAVSDTMYDTIDEVFICGYGVDDYDNKVTAEQRAEGVLNYADDGVIILLHDSEMNYQTIEALDTIIPELLEQGYQFVTVSQLFEAKGVAVDTGVKKIYTVVSE